MADTPWYERKVKKLMQRDWTELRSLWLEDTPTIDPPGSGPMLPVGELADLQLILSKIDKHNNEYVQDPVAGLRPGILHEGIFLLHKAAHVLGSAQVHVKSGMFTWSVSTAYHAAFFAAKAVMDLLGLAIVESDNRFFLIDCWAAPEGRGAKSKYRFPCNLMMNCRRIEPRQTWLFCQRILAVTVKTDDIWDADRVQDILDREPSDFGRHRNNLHYHAEEWYLEDLHSVITDDNFGVRPNGANDSSCLDVQQYDFSLFLAIILVRMGCRMLQQLAEYSADIQLELDLLTNWLAGGHSALYQQAYP